MVLQSISVEQATVTEYLLIPGAQPRGNPVTSVGKLITVRTDLSLEFQSIFIFGKVETDCPAMSVENGSEKQHVWCPYLTEHGA